MLHHGWKQQHEGVPASASASTVAPSMLEVEVDAVCLIPQVPKRRNEEVAICGLEQLRPLWQLCRVGHWLILHTLPIALPLIIVALICQNSLSLAHQLPALHTRAVMSGSGHQKYSMNY